MRNWEGEAPVELVHISGRWLSRSFALPELNVAFPRIGSEPHEP
jgi:hypothetical protein